MNEKEEIYEKSKLGGRAGFGKRPVVFVIDMQKGFTQPDAPGGGGMDSTVEAVNELIDAAREKNVKVFFFRVGYRKDGIDLGVFGHKAFVLREFTRDSRFYELDDRLKIKDEDVVMEKHWSSAFFGTHLVQSLITMHIDTVIITGCTTAGCVNCTVIDSCSYGFRTVVVEEGVADRSEETHNMFLFNMGNKYADVIKLKEVIEAINKLDKLEYDLLW